MSSAHWMRVEFSFFCRHVDAVRYLLTWGTAVQITKGSLSGNWNFFMVVRRSSHRLANVRMSPARFVVYRMVLRHIEYRMFRAAKQCLSPCTTVWKCFACNRCCIAVLFWLALIAEFWMLATDVILHWKHQKCFFQSFFNNRVFDAELFRLLTYIQFIHIIP